MGISHCVEGEIIQLRHTPVRQDVNGVSVFRLNGEQLGWIPREYTREIAFLLDRGAEVKAVFEQTFSRNLNGPKTAIILIVKPDTVPKNITKLCGYCGTQLDREAKKCPSCRKNICVNCGNLIGTGVTKCPKCGESTTMGGIQVIGCLLGFLGIGIIIFLVVFFTTC
jgi:hypothetical protein